MVAMTARSEGGFIGFEVFLLSALLGLASGSWIVWLGTYLGLFMALGTTTGKILGTMLSVVWAVFVINLKRANSLHFSSATQQFPTYCTYLLNYHTNYKK